MHEEGERQVHFDYEKADWRFVSGIMEENSSRMSRSHGGVSDTSASGNKRPLLLAGETLRRQTVENERRVHQWIMDTRTARPPVDAAGVQALLFTAADLTNVGLLPEGRLRNWNVKYPLDKVEDDGNLPAPNEPVPVEALPATIATFCQTIHDRWDELTDDPIPLAAWAEWHLNAGPLHPFYDGCGRISKLFAALLLARASWLLPLYQDRKTYFAHANRGPSAFGDYMRQRIASCETWIAEEETSCL